MPLTEFDIIDQYFRNLTGNDKQVNLGIGDDAAVIDVPPGQKLVASVDTLVSGVHFFTDADAADIGYKSLAVNLSDMAAMAARPAWATLALTLPESDPEWLGKFANGFSELAKQHGVSLVGGDLTHGPLSVTVQVMGLIEKHAILTRGGAEVDDLIYVSGSLGGAGLALCILKGEAVDDIQPTTGSVNKLLRPTPRVALGLELGGLATAAIDISDGLAADLGHVLKSSGRGAAIDLDQVPLCEDLRQLADQDRQWQIALCSGDDYELCFTVPPKHQDRLKQISRDLEVPLSCIGRITEGDTVSWLRADGSEFEPDVNGYRHF